MSTIKADTLSNLAGTQTVPVSTVAQGSAKAWVNFNGTGTVAIRASFNVSSITDNGTGDYTVNFTTALPDANYALTSCASGELAGASNNAVVASQNSSQTTTGARVYSVVSSSTAAFDATNYNVAIFR
jgi:hypothetical protein